MAVVGKRFGPRMPRGVTGVPPGSPGSPLIQTGSFGLAAVLAPAAGKVPAHGDSTKARTAFRGANSLAWPPDRTARFGSAPRVARSNFMAASGTIGRAGAGFRMIA